MTYHAGITARMTTDSLTPDSSPPGSLKIGDLAVLVPVKDLTRAKTRLAGLLNPEERRELAHIMLRGVLTGIAAMDSAANFSVDFAVNSAADSTAGSTADSTADSTREFKLRRTVVTNYPPAIEMARELGFDLIREDRQISESHSVDAASAMLEKEGVRGVLRIPLDLPLFTGLALETMLAAILAPHPTLAIPQANAQSRQDSQTKSSKGRAVLAPSRDRLGTNALFRSPPTLFPSRFGHDSLALHTREARGRNAAVTVLEVEELALDIDDPADVAELVRRGIRCPALEFLESIGIAGRIGEWAGERIGEGTTGQKR